MNIHEYLTIQPCKDGCDDPGYSTTLFLTNYDCSEKIRKEKESADILTLYK